jgi:hypothetical protein
MPEVSPDSGEMGNPTAGRPSTGARAALLGGLLELVDAGCRESGCEAGVHSSLLSLGLLTASMVR